MDKRSNPRYATLLKALVHPAIGRSWLCTIQDFCSGGMLLVEPAESRSRRAMPGIVTGETVGIHFSVPDSGKDKHFRLEGNIVRVMDSGVGIKFAKGIDADAMTALLKFGESQLQVSTPRQPVVARPNAGQPSQGEPAKRDASRPAAAKSVNLAPPVANRVTPEAASKAPSTSNAPKLKLTAAASSARPRLSQRPRHGASVTATSAASAMPSKTVTAELTSEADALPLGVRLPGPITAAEAKKVIGEVRRRVVRVLPEMISALFSYMDDELLRLARDAKSNAVQSEYFAAMSNLEKAKKEVSQAFNHDILDQIDRPKELQALLAERKAAELARKQTEAKKTKLTLVDTDDFEDWLAIANIISRSERAYEKYLQDIRARMGMLVDAWGHKEANPIGTTVFCYAFDDAIHRVELTKDIRQKVYVGFETKAVPLFFKLYVDTTKILEDSQLFPDADESFFTPLAAKEEADVETASSFVLAESAAAEGVGPVGKPPTLQADAADDKQQAALEDAYARSQSAGESREVKRAVKAETDIREELAELRDELRQQRGTGAHVGRASPPSAASERGLPRAQGHQESRALSDIYSTVRDLLARQNPAPVDAQESDIVGTEEVRELLRSIQPAADIGSRLNVREQLQRSISSAGGSRQLAAEVRGHIDVVENLVDSIEDDAVLSGSAKSWIRQLELTLDKVATNEGNLLDEENPHPSMAVINQLAKLGGAESGSMRRQVDQIVTQINQNFDSDPQVFDSALQQLAPLLDRQSRAFTGNIQRTVKASEGRQTLVNAQRAVVSELDQRLAGRRVPKVMMKLLMPGWRNLMVNTYLRQGEGSTAWQQQLQALDQVVEHLNGTADPATSENYKAPEELLEQIEQGLDSIAFEPGKRVPLLKNLRELIVDRKGLDQVQTIDLGSDSVAETLGFGETTQRDKRRQRLRTDLADNRDWQQCLERASRLHVGEWLSFTATEGDDEIAIVAWKNPEHANYVFVNRRGVKTRELIVEDLASQFQDGTAKVLEEADIPLSDRASHRMLQNMHNQLTHQASHDAVTGLINRKEFERALSVALTHAKRDSSMHLVAYFDLDQFKVINNAVGHEAGDKLLLEIGEEMRKVLGSSGGILARLGGDEFGLLVEKCGKTEGLELVKQLCKTVKDYAFNSNEQVFRLTASCGVMHVDKEVSSEQVIMQCADAACFAAKDAGRDRIHVYEADDSEMGQRRGVMDFVAQIDKALEEDRFVLNCQMIAPIDKSSGEHAHYEILLTVLDDNNEPLPPQDFIIAAETYNRMGAIDRWVIANAFEFIASNILSFSDLGAFSINISGNSLTEDDFMEFVLGQFKKTRVPTSMICFEITETSAVGSLDDAVEFIEKLQVLGVKFSLDDFGTGLSSYSYLRSLPVDYLKIDGVFVKDIENNPNDYAVVKSINEIGHFMGKKTIAEYVENDAVLAILSEIGVDFAQGFGVGKKFPITELL